LGRGRSGPTKNFLPDLPIFLFLSLRVEPELVRRVAERYSSVSARMYARGKLGSDPIAGQLVALGRDRSLGDVVDVGCGRGQMGILLLEAGVASRVTGVDWDEGKLADARAAAAGLEATFEKGDVRETAPPVCDTLLLVDVLHYLTDKQQIEVLERCMQSARKCVVLRELDPDRGWRSATTRVQEAVTTFFGYNVGERVRVLPIASFTGPLERAGFTVRVEPSWGKTPFSNVAVIATR
jgi:trans-aconitate methyltransferase